LVVTYPVGHECWGGKYSLYESAVGNQDTLYGAVQFIIESWDTGVLIDLLACSLPHCQTQSPQEVRYRHTLDAALTIYRSEGFRAFYRGLVPSLLGILHVAVQFPLYEQLKIVARKHLSLSSFTLFSFRPIQFLGHFLERGSDVPLSNQTILLCSAMAKMTASIATYPHEVVRTRLQTEKRPLITETSSDGMIKAQSPRGIVNTTIKIIRVEGWSGLYKGLSINLFRTVPNSAVTMLT